MRSLILGMKSFILLFVAVIIGFCDAEKLGQGYEHPILQISRQRISKQHRKKDSSNLRQGTSTSTIISKALNNGEDCTQIGQFLNSTNGRFDDVVCACNPNDFNTTIGVSCGLLCPICSNDDIENCATLRVSENFAQHNMNGAAERYTETYQYVFGKRNAATLEMEQSDCTPVVSGSSKNNRMSCSSCSAKVDGVSCSSCVPKACSHKPFGYQLDCSNVAGGDVWDTCEEESLSSINPSSVFAVLSANHFDYSGECPGEKFQPKEESSPFGSPELSPGSESIFGSPVEVPESRSIFGSPLDVPDSRTIFGSPVDIPEPRSIFGSPVDVPESKSIFGSPVEVPNSNRGPILPLILDSATAVDNPPSESVSLSNAQEMTPNNNKVSADDRSTTTTKSKPVRKTGRQMPVEDPPSRLRSSGAFTWRYICMSNLSTGLAVILYFIS